MQQQTYLVYTSNGSASQTFSFITQNRLSESPFYPKPLIRKSFLPKTAYQKVLFTQNHLSESPFYPKPLIRNPFLPKTTYQKVLLTQNRLSESPFYPKPLITKPFLPNVGKTLTAQKTYLASEERSVKNRKQTLCLMQCRYFKHL
jgi:hypothetical protein